jgi:predicted XRE-type DNA-binding protein
LTEDEKFGKANRQSVKQVFVWQLTQAKKQSNTTKKAISKKMGVKRAAINRLFDPDDTSVTLSTLDRAAAAVGKRLIVALVDDNAAALPGMHPLLRMGIVNLLIRSGTPPDEINDTLMKLTQLITEELIDDVRKLIKKKSS